MLVLTTQNFQQEVLDATEPVLVDFWGAWCRPCHALAPVLERVADALPNVKIGKVNVDEQPSLSGEYKIQALPTLLFFKNGQVVDRLVGLQNEATLVSNLERLSE